MVARNIPDWLLERVALGELPDEELAALRRQIAEDSALQQRLADLERSNAEILAAHPPSDMAHEIDQRRHLREVEAAVGRRRRVTWSAIGGATVLVGAAAMLMLYARTPAGPEVDQPRHEVIRLKGGPQLVVQRLAAGGAESLANDDIAAAGDRLQIGYRAGRPDYGVILSVDGRGTITVHFPQGDHAERLMTQRVISLDHSYELDAAPSFEDFFLVTSPEPFDVRRVVDAARAWQRHDGGELPLPAGFAQTSLHLRKGS